MCSPPYMYSSRMQRLCLAVKTLPPRQIVPLFLSLIRPREKNFPKRIRFSFFLRLCSASFFSSLEKKGEITVLQAIIQILKSQDFFSPNRPCRTWQSVAAMTFENDIDFPRVSNAKKYEKKIREISKCTCGKLWCFRFNSLFIPFPDTLGCQPSR